MNFETFKLRDGTELSAPMHIPMDVGMGVGQAGYQVFLQEHTKNIHLHMEAISLASKLSFKDVKRVLHPFGGLGMAAQCMNKTLGGEITHDFWERDKNCCIALRELFPNALVMEVRDSFKQLIYLPASMLEKYDLVLLDPTAMTAKKENLWPVWEKLASSGIRHVWFVDSAISKIWLHTQTYTAFFSGKVENIHDYFDQYDARLKKLGYGIRHLCREGTVVYGCVQMGYSSNYPLAIEDLRR